MKEIKFRAWNHFEKRWINFDKTKLTCHGISRWHYELLNDTKTQDWEWNQYTGLKDRSGKEIYEGDILSSPNPPSCDLRHYVEWSDKYHGWQIISLPMSENKNKTDGCPQLWAGLSDANDFGGFKIIGNLYENPELLK